MALVDVVKSVVAHKGDDARSDRAREAALKMTGR